MKNHIDERDLDAKMILMGFRENVSGTTMLRDAIGIWRPGMQFKELYAEVARIHNSTPSQVERNCRYAIACAWDAAGPNSTANFIFGGSIYAHKGNPTVSEFVTRMARVCSLDD